MKEKYFVIGLIENVKNFLMKRKFMDSAEGSYAKICGVVVKSVIIFLSFLKSLLTCYELYLTGKSC